MIQTRCRYFNGYKPCGRNTKCSHDCEHKDLIQHSVLIVHLGALGAVVRSTSLLPLIQKKYPHSLITWVTDKPADQLLKNHPQVDRVFTTSPEDLLQLSALKFDVGFVVDKSLKAVAISQNCQIEKRFGFGTEAKTGAIVPLTPAAVELWNLGLDNHQKFFINQKSEQQLVAEALEIANPSEEMPAYHLPLTSLEESLKEKRRAEWQINRSQMVIGINTGCSHVIPAKKLSVVFQRQIIQKLSQLGFENLVLLGGPEDRERNQEIGQSLPVFQSPTDQGLRDGLVSVAACDLVLTGDSLGMHMAISQNKFVVAWFGPTCAQEIDLYGRGVKIQTQAACAPCWKRTCDQAQMCYDQVSLEDILKAIQWGQKQILEADHLKSKRNNGNEANSRHSNSFPGRSSSRGSTL